MRHRAFTLIELLVVVAIIALLIGILLPALSKARRAGHTVKCLANIRSLEQAHYAYLNDHDGRFADVGLPHGGIGDPSVSFITTLAEYYGTPLALRSPVDRSAHWPTDEGGTGVPPPGNVNLRVTSYGMNNLLSRTYNPNIRVGSYAREPWDRLDKVHFPFATVQFLMMAREGEFAASDHVHVEDWLSPGAPLSDAPQNAAAQMDTGAHGGRSRSFDAVSNYGFLDGHAETLRFSGVYTDLERNRFHPEFAH